MESVPVSSLVGEETAWQTLALREGERGTVEVSGWARRVWTITDDWEVREEWLVEDGWWTQKPLRRRYFELVLEDGSDVVVFCEPETGRWFRQRD